MSINNKALTAHIPVSNCSQYSKKKYRLVSVILINISRHKKQPNIQNNEAFTIE